jgi:hypothetical protein
MELRKSTVGRSSTGVYHNICGDSSACNGRSFRGYEVSLDLINKAPEEMFCKKCFYANKFCASRKDHAIYIYMENVA